MNFFEVDGKSYDVIVTNIQRSAKIMQSENAGVTIGSGAEEILDPIGTFVSYSVTVKRRKGHEKEFDELWDILTRPIYDGVFVNIVYNQSTIKFKAKFSVDAQNIERIDKKTGKVYWGEMNINIVPIKAQVLPE